MIGRPIRGPPSTQVVVYGLGPPDQGDIMTLDARIMHTAAGALLSGLIIWGYVSLCLSYAVDCF
jgi:hypothetical protein